jgi:hypothetical protein
MSANLFVVLPFLMFAVALSLLPTVLLLVVGWRMMRAQEATAEALRQLANQPRG